MQVGRDQLQAQARALIDAARSPEARYDRAALARQLAQALDLYRTLEDRAGQVNVLVLLGNNANNVADHVGALDYLYEAQEIAATLSDPDLDRKVRGQLMGVHEDLGDLPTALRLATEEWECSLDSDDPEVCLNARNLLGCVMVAMGDHAGGVDRIRDSLQYIERIEPARRRGHLHAQSMADLSVGLLGLGSHEEALQRAREGAATAKTIDHAPLIALNEVYAARAALALSQPELALELLESALAMCARMGLKALEIQARYEMAEALDRLHRPAQALESYRAAHALEKTAKKEEAFRRAEFLRARKEIEHSRNERETAERMLFTVLPQAIATRMRNGEERIADDIRDASVLFTDLVGFTALSARTPPRELLAILERVFSTFDRLTAEHRLEKIKTIGDAYMAVGGALTPAADHLEGAARLAFAMLDAMDRIRADTGTALAIRVGLHAGPAIAGVIGANRLSYDMWGETVNMASRLESTGMAGRVHVSNDVAQRLQGLFEIEERPARELKGFGEMRTFFLNRR